MTGWLFTSINPIYFDVHPNMPGFWPIAISRLLIDASCMSGVANIWQFVGEDELPWIISFFAFCNGHSRNFVSTVRCIIIYAVWGDIFGRQHGDAQKLGSLFSLIRIHLPPYYAHAPSADGRLFAARMLPRLFPTYTHAAPATVGEVDGLQEIRGNLSDVFQMRWLRCIKHCE